MAEPIHMVSDYACPWCYLGFDRIKKVGAEAGRSIELVHFPLAPNLPPEGKTLQEHLGARINLSEAVARLSGLMEAQGLVYPTDLAGRRVYNTARAQELALFAIAQGLEPVTVHDALFKAYQVDNLNLFDVEVLVQLASDWGLDADAAREAIISGAFVGQREGHWRSARGAGVSSVPTFIADGQGVVGAQSEDVLRRWLEPG